MDRSNADYLRCLLLLSLGLWHLSSHTHCIEATSSSSSLRRYKNAYATMMYMGTPRDYEFYIAVRVLLKSLTRLNIKADLVVIASLDVPLPWIRALENEDGAKVVRVKNMDNPYKQQDNFDKRFKLSLNKLYAWSLVDYERVVMLDADNLYAWSLVEYERVVMLDADNLLLQHTDELFQCGQFCAVFINPCVFHTGLFVLQPSMVVFKDMVNELQNGRENPDGADQGFIASYFPDLLDKPMFHPPSNGTKLDGTYRLPLGYQMDASYFYLKLRWSIPCGPNSVITFPGASWLKPWYWWSWPVLPLGLQWHEQRRQTLGYSAEMAVILIQSAIYLGIIAMTRLARPTLSKLCHKNSDKSINLVNNSFKLVALWCILAAYITPFFIIPHTIHPLPGWILYLLGSFAFCSIAINTLVLPMLSVLIPWLGIFGVLIVMAFPWYPDGVVRALAVFGYAFCFAPFLWVSIVRIVVSLRLSLEREAFLPRLVESSPHSWFNKLY